MYKKLEASHEALKAERESQSKYLPLVCNLCPRMHNSHKPTSVLVLSQRRRSSGGAAKARLRVTR